MAKKKVTTSSENSTSLTFGAKLKVFGNPLTITPNTKVPTRIEYHSGDADGENIATKIQAVVSSIPQLNDVATEFGKALADLGTEIFLQDVIIDVSEGNKEVALGVRFKETGTFFLNKYPKVFSLESVDFFLDVKQG